MLIENETINCTESEHLLNKKDPGFPISLARIHPPQTSDDKAYSLGIEYRGNKFKRHELVKIRKAMLCRCKDIIANNIKLEEPINFSKFFQDALSDMKTERAEDKPSIVTDRSVQKKRNFGRNNPKGIVVSSEKKIRNRTINVNQLVTIEHESVANSFITTPADASFEVFTKLPNIDSKK